MIVPSAVQQTTAMSDTHNIALIAVGHSTLTARVPLSAWKMSSEECWAAESQFPELLSEIQEILFKSLRDHRRLYFKTLPTESDMAARVRVFQRGML